MLRFFEPEPISGVSLEHKNPNLVSFSWESKVSGMPKESVFPFLPSSLHSNNFAGSKESLVRNSNVSSGLDRLNNYSGRFLMSSQGCDSFQLNELSSLPSLNPIQGQSSMATDQPVESKQTNLTNSQYNAMVDRRKQRKHTMDQSSTHENKRQKSASLSSRDRSNLQLLKSQGAAKKSQKLGDKITALQQLVSPFGKTDTASVLHEASACIKVLHEQIRVLSSPYFGIKASPGLLGNVGMEPSLQQRGLCLVPISTTAEDLRNDPYVMERMRWEAAAATGLHLN